jgi:hypothetical protein
MSLQAYEFKKLRALKMIEARVMQGKSVGQIAKDFNVHPDTVTRTLSWAKKADILGQYEDKIVNELIPLAHDAIKTALIDGDAKVAVEIFKGMRLLRTGAETPASKKADDDLAAYIAAKRDHAELQENTILAEIVEEIHHALPAAGQTGPQNSPLPATHLSALSPLDAAEVCAVCCEDCVETLTSAAQRTLIQGSATL